MGILSVPFQCLCQKLSLSLLCFNKTLLHKCSEPSSLISGTGLNSSPLEAKDLGVFLWFSNNLSMGIPDHLTYLLRSLYAVRKRQLELDMEQQTGSKLGKEYIKAVYCHPAYLTSTQSSAQFSSNESTLCMRW